MNKFIVLKDTNSSFVILQILLWNLNPRNELWGYFLESFLEIGKE